MSQVISRAKIITQFLVSTQFGLYTWVMFHLGQQEFRELFSVPTMSYRNIAVGY